MFISTHAPLTHHDMKEVQVVCHVKTWKQDFFNGSPHPAVVKQRNLTNMTSPHFINTLKLLISDIFPTAHTIKPPTIV